ncbi:uncharacterized protein K02A2.6-like [Mizuhopecten yessoensis]|uniref:uncharacterized protein K02A2.6-like n=1 Tax=Mizuhopecten yessoensis TaxID=6573 RepID=UPI000B458C5C|nr:uncharacterized protein K02A2.6-like [Mizuhopecten yessoensis]
MKYTFAGQGVPKEVYSDNGPQFSSREFRQFARNYDFQHTTSSPNFPQSNGLAEKCVGIVKNLLKKTREDKGDFYMNLLVYRTTPLKHGKSPFELLHGRKARSNLPIIDSQLIVKSQSSEKFRKERYADKVKQKFYYDKRVRELPPLDRGNTVRIRDCRDSAWSTKGVVREEVSPRSYLVESETGNTYRRNRKDILKCMDREVVESPTPDIVDSDQIGSRTCTDFDDERQDITPVSSPIVLRKSERTIKRPDRLIEEI